MTQASTADIKPMTEGQKLEFKDHLATFMERMVQEFDKMEWGYESHGNDLMLGGNAMMATTFHAVLLTSCAVLLRARCPGRRVVEMILEAGVILPALAKDIQG